MTDHKKSPMFAYLLDGNGKAKRLKKEEWQNWTPEQGILWIHGDYTHLNTMRWLKRRSGIDSLAVDALLVDESRPRSVVNHKSILVILRSINQNPGQNPEDMVSLRIWFDEHRIITTERRKVFVVDEIRQRLELGEGPKTTTQFFLLLNELIAHSIAENVEELAEHVDNLDDEILTESHSEVRRKISAARHDIIQIRRYLSPQREALQTLQYEQSSLLTHIDQSHIRETSDRIIRSIEELDSSRERATISQDELFNRLSEQINNRMYALSLIAVVFLPITFFTGLFGANVGGIPWSNSPYGFLWICLAVFLQAVGIVLGFRYKKWI